MIPLSKINTQLQEIESSLLVQKRKNFMFGNHFYKNMTSKVFFNKDYEPYAIQRDTAICEL
jgi:deoxyribodipyrimidine photo-lyase